MKNILAAPLLYDMAQFAMRGSRYAPRFVADHVRVKSGDRVLDIGCGTGVMLRYMPGVRYIGFDMSRPYIEACRKRFGRRGEFHCRLLTADSVADFGTFDVVLAVGVVHHLADDEAANMFSLAEKALTPNGRLITLDGVYTDDQSKLVKWFLANDRGRFVRTESAYEALATGGFAEVRTTVIHDLFRIPYTVLVMECSK